MSTLNTRVFSPTGKNTREYFCLQSNKEIATKIGCSMGEAVDYLVFQYNHPRHTQASYPNYDLTPMVSENAPAYKTKNLFSNEQVKFIQTMLQKELKKRQKARNR